jgi:hypothetical protein
MDLDNTWENDKDIQRMRKEQEEFDQMLEESTGIISDSLTLKTASHRNMKTFFMFKSLDTPILCESFASTASGLHVSTVKYHSEYKMPKIANKGTDIYFFGLLTTKKEYPETYVCRETLREKISNLFVQQDVDFKASKKFSRRFHVITKDKEKLALLLDYKELNEFCDFPNMELELNGKSCLFRCSRLPVSPKEAKRFTEMAKIVLRVFT